MKNGPDPFIHVLLTLRPPPHKYFISEENYFLVEMQIDVKKVLLKIKVDLSHLSVLPYLYIYIYIYL